MCGGGGGEVEEVEVVVCVVREEEERGRNPPPRHVPEPKKAQETDRLNSQVLAQVSLHPEPLHVCSLGQVMQGRDLAQLFICDPQNKKKLE